MKQSRYYVALALMLVTVLVSLIAPVAASAQTLERAGLSVSPPTFEFPANPGDTITNSIRVENITDEPLSVTVDVRNFSALGEEGQVNLSDEDNSYALAKWISISPGAATIAGKESKTFNYTIIVPLNAQPGGRFGSIVFKTAPKAAGGGTNVAVGQEVGALVFMKIAGDVREKASIETFKAAKGLYEYGPVGFEARVKNAGNVQFKPSGTITITNLFGKVVETIPVDSRNVLPGAIRKMESSWKHKWLFGPYTATISLTYGAKSQIITASTSFWGFPLKIIAIVLAVLIVAVVVIFRGRRRLAKTFKVLFGKE